MICFCRAIKNRSIYIMNMHFKDSSLKNSISRCSVIEKQKTQGQISNVHVIKNANFGFIGYILPELFGNFLYIKLMYLK